MPQVSLSAPNAARLAIAALSLLTGCGSGQGTYSQEPTTVPQVVEFAAPEASQGGSPGPAPSGAPFVTAFAEAEPAGDEVWENAEAMMACCNRRGPERPRCAPITQQPKMLGDRCVLPGRGPVGQPERRGLGVARRWDNLPVGMEGWRAWQPVRSLLMGEAAQHWPNREVGECA